MNPATLLPVLLLSATVQAAPAPAPSLVHAWRAQRLLNGQTWTRVVRIRNRAPGRYAAEVDALIFELVGALWFYTDADGTQSLSQYLHRTGRDKADLGPLLHTIEPGFGELADAPPVAAASGDSGELPNGCFIQSLSLLLRRLSAGMPAAQPRLLSYYVQTRQGLLGHTVLQFREGSGWRVVDPLRPGKKILLYPRKPEDPRSSAVLLRPDIAGARFLPLDGVFAPKAEFTVALRQPSNGGG